MNSQLILVLLLVGTLQQSGYTEQVARINQIGNYSLASCTKLAFSVRYLVGQTAYRKIRITVFNQSNIRSILFTDAGDLQASCLAEDDIYTACTRESSFCSCTDCAIQTSRTWMRSRTTR